MNILYVIVSIISLVITIIVLVKFFQIASDIRSINSQLKPTNQIISDINFIKQRFDGEQNYLTEERSISEIKFLIANGYNDEAKRMLLRKVWKHKAENPYRDIKQEYNHYFIKLGLTFPNDEDFPKK